MPLPLTIREVRPEEHEALGRLMVGVYSTLDGFPTPAEQPRYYEMLADIARLGEKPATHVLVATTADGELVGGIVYFDDMAQYGSGGTATQEKHAAGIRLLGVDPKFRGAGAGKALATACLQRAREQGHTQVILHTTAAMTVAWKMYEQLGFARSEDLDFLQEALPVFGFRLRLGDTASDARQT